MNWRRAAKYAVLTAAVGISMLVGVEFIRALQPAAAREVKAACKAMKPAPQNKAFARFPQTAPVFTAQNTSDKMVNLAELRGRVTLVNFWASWCEVCKAEKPSLYELQREYGDRLQVVALASDSDWTAVHEAWRSTVAEASFIASADRLWRSIIFDRPSWIPGEYIERVTKQMRTNPNAKIAPPSQAVAKAWMDFRVVTSPLPQAPPFQILLDPPASENDNLGRVARSYGIKAVPESFLIDEEGIIRYYFINKRDWSSGIANTCIRSVLDEA